MANPKTYEPFETRREAVIWAAGFFDGEGCVVLRRRKRKCDWTWWPFNHVLSMHVAQTDPGPLGVLENLWGGGVVFDQRNYDKTGRHRNLHRWQCGSRICAGVLEEMLPFLVAKRPQAEVALEFQERRGLGRVKVKDQAQDELDYLMLQDLKRPDRYVLGGGDLG